MGRDIALSFILKVLSPSWTGHNYPGMLFGCEKSVSLPLSFCSHRFVGLGRKGSRRLESLVSSWNKQSRQQGVTKFTDLQRNLRAGIVTWRSEGEGLGLEKELYSVSLNQNRGREGRVG